MVFITKILKGDVTGNDSQRRFLAQHSVATLLRHCFEWFQHCSNIATLCCAKNRRCESTRVTLPLITFPETRFYEPARLSSPHPNPSFHKNRWTPAWLRLLLSRSSIFCLSFIYPVSKMTTTLKKKIVIDVQHLRDGLTRGLLCKLPQETDSFFLSPRSAVKKAPL